MLYKVHCAKWMTGGSVCAFADYGFLAMRTDARSQGSTALTDGEPSACIS